jgi:outer membrane receptor protein involved in Fe transport
VNYSAGSGPTGTTTGDSFADQLSGYPSFGSYSINASYAKQQIYWAGYAQDDWRETDKMTISCGVRYDFENPITERFNKQVSGFCFSCPSPIQSKFVGIHVNGGLEYASSDHRYAYPRYWKGVQPRLGVNYPWTPTTAFRAGFGTIFLNPLYSQIGTGYTQSTNF